MTALFEPAGDTVVATELSRGPWDPAACHGGPVAALLTDAVERCEPGEITWQVSRLTVELIRPVPVGRPLSLRAALERPGRKVSLVGAGLFDGDTEVARARALRVRRDTLELVESVVEPVDHITVAPDGLPSEEFGLGQDGLVSFAHDACDHRAVAGSAGEPGAITMWMRLVVPLLPGHELSGAARAAAVADFGNGVSRNLDFDRYTFINPDLTVHLLRPPTGEWIGMASRSYYGDAGAGLAESALYDARGRVGRSVQSLFLDVR